MFENCFELSLERQIRFQFSTKQEILLKKNIDKRIFHLLFCEDTRNTFDFIFIWILRQVRKFKTNNVTQPPSTIPQNFLPHFLMVLSSGQMPCVWFGVMTTFVVTNTAPFSAGGTTAEGCHVYFKVRSEFWLHSLYVFLDTAFKQKGTCLGLRECPL